MFVYYMQIDPSYHNRQNYLFVFARNHEEAQKKCLERFEMGDSRRDYVQEQIWNCKAPFLVTDGLLLEDDY